MLFKVFDTTGKFVQYASICITDEDLKLSKLEDIVMTHFQKDGLSRLSRVTSCNYNYYSWQSSSLHFVCYGSLNNSLSFSLDEILSEKRKKYITAYQQISPQTHRYTSSRIYDSFIGVTGTTIVNSAANSTVSAAAMANTQTVTGIQGTAVTIGANPRSTMIY